MAYIVTQEDLDNYPELLEQGVVLDQELTEGEKWRYLKEGEEANRGGGGPRPGTVPFP